MSDRESSRGHWLFSWRLAGSWLILLAVLLSAAAITLAFLQAGHVSTQLIAAAEPRADRLKRDARERFENSARNALLSALRYVDETSRETRWVQPKGWPAWLDNVYAWDGSRLHTLTESGNQPNALAGIVQTRLISDVLTDDEPVGKGFKYILEETGGERITCVYTRTSSHDALPAAVAACVNATALKRAVLDPLQRPEDGLEIIPADQIEGPWSHLLPGPYRAWAVQPSRKFRREQDRQMLLQTASYAGLTMLSLGTLLVSMWLLTQLARRQTALAELKADFVARVSHELKTPLALIRMFGETLESGRVATEEKRREYYSVIARESARLSNLIDNILDFARIDAGKQQYELKPTDIGEVVTETYEAYRLQLDHRGFGHSMTLANDLVPILADRDAIAQALINLMGNAIKYSEDEKHLEIEVTRDTRRDRNGVLISVRDRGIGISPEDRRHLFEGFYRADDSRVRQRGGTGLGLSVVKHIVDAHGGSLDVEGRLVKGTTFRIFLPVGDTSDRSAVSADEDAEKT